MRNIEVADELLNKAFGLAYFILGDRSAAIYVTMAATDKLKAALKSQTLRLKYTPTGRLQQLATRTKINLSESHLLQRLVYIECELFEKIFEAQKKNLTQDDLIIRYIKHLIRITTKNNSFYVALGMCRLLFNFSTAEAAEIYNLVLQDPGRIPDDHYFRARKQYLIRELKNRFGDLVRTHKGIQREERFESQEDSQTYSRLVRECLVRFTPWDSACVLPKKLDPRENVIPELSFRDDDPDEEHEVELNRLHTLIHPDCLRQLTMALGLDTPEDRLELPFFFISGEGARPTEERFHAVLDSDELDVMRHNINKKLLYQKELSVKQLQLLVDGIYKSDVEQSSSHGIKFQVAYGSELVEVRSFDVVETENDESLAVCLIPYGPSGICEFNAQFSIGKRLCMLITATPAAEELGEPRGATLELSCEHMPRLPPISRSLSTIGLLREKLSLTSSRFHFLKPALATSLLLFLSLGGVWLYVHLRTRTNSEVAQLQEEQKMDNPAVVPLSSPVQPTPHEEQSQPPKHGKRGSAVIAARIKGSERVRGVVRRPTASLLPAIKRVYVDLLGNDLFSKQLRRDLIDGLRGNTRFVLVENRDDADAVFERATIKRSRHETEPATVIILVNGGGQTIWSASLRGNNDPSKASARIMQMLLRDIERLNQQ